MVIVQTLCTRWTKESRGAPNAARRNATPEIVPLDPARVIAEETTWHEVTFEEPTFALVEAYRPRSLPNDFLRVSAHFEEDLATLSLSLFGKRCLRLARGQSGRIVYNLSDDAPQDGWYRTVFQKVIVHVAFGLVAQTHLFNRCPDHEHISMRDLT